MNKNKFQLYKIPKCKYCNKEMFFRIDDDFCSNKCRDNYNKNVINQCKDIYKSYKN